MQTILLSVQKHLALLSGKGDDLLMLRKTASGPTLVTISSPADIIPFLAQLRTSSFYDRNGIRRMDGFGDTTSGFFTGPQYCPTLLNTTLPLLQSAITQSLLSDPRYAGATFRVVPLPLALLDDHDSPDERYYTYGRWTARAYGPFSNLKFAAGFDREDTVDYLLNHVWETISLPRSFWSTTPLSGDNPIEVLDVDERVYLFAVLCDELFPRAACKPRLNPTHGDFFAKHTKSSDAAIDRFYTLSKHKMTPRSQFSCHTYFESLPMFHDLSKLHVVETLVKLSNDDLRAMRNKIARDILHIRESCSSSWTDSLKKPFDPRCKAAWKTPAAGSFVPSYLPLRIGKARNACASLYAISAEDGPKDLDYLRFCMMGSGPQHDHQFDTIAKASTMRFDMNELTADAVTLLTSGMTNTLEPERQFPFVQPCATGLEPVALVRSSKRRTEPVFLQPRGKKKRLPLDDVATEEIAESIIVPAAAPEEPPQAHAQKIVQETPSCERDKATCIIETDDTLIDNKKQTDEAAEDDSATISEKLAEAHEQVSKGSAFSACLLNKFKDLQLVHPQDSFAEFGKVPQPIKPLRFDCPVFRKQYDETRKRIYGMKTYDGKGIEMECAKKELKRWVLLFGNLKEAQRERFEDEQRALHKEVREDADYYAGKLYPSSDGSWWYHVHSKVLFNPNPWEYLEDAGPQELFRLMRYKPSSTSNVWEHHMPSGSKTTSRDMTLWESYSRFRAFNATMLQYIHRFA